MIVSTSSAEKYARTDVRAVRSRRDKDGKEQAGASKTPARWGNVKGQLMLKRRLDRIAEGKLAVALNHNRSQWESLTPEERQKYRRAVLAYQHQDPQKQRQLLKHYEKLIKMSAERRKAYRRRAEWLKVVVESLDDEQREKLKRMSPRDRAKFLLDRKNELIEKGEIRSHTPAAQPAATKPEPDTQPADEN